MVGSESSEIGIPGTGVLSVTRLLHQNSIYATHCVWEWGSRGQ